VRIAAQGVLTVAFTIGTIAGWSLFLWCDSPIRRKIEAIVVTVVNFTALVMVVPD